MKKGDITVLVIDDDANFRQSLTEMIKRFGYKVSPVGKPDEALNMIKLRPVHAAVVDVLLPKMNGIELVNELRKTTFGKSPVVFISGLFRDKAQIQESIRKTEAVEFLTKPFEVRALKAILDTALSPLIQDTQQIQLSAILSKAYSTSRERIRAMESIESISGYDIPFILTILMNDNVSGNLTLSDDDGEIIGISMVRGAISKLDNSDSQKILTDLVIEKGFITAEELTEIPKEKLKGDIIKCLIGESLASPHSLFPLTHTQILMGLRKLTTHKSYRFTFSTGDVSDVGNFLTFDKCIAFFNDATGGLLTDAYLNEFYQPWLEHPIRKSSHFQLQNAIFTNSTIQAGAAVLEGVDQELTLEETLRKVPNRVAALKAIHMLSLCHFIMFDDVNRHRSTLEHFQKLRDVLKAIEGKDATGIFVYFGSSPDVKVQEVERIYKEFAKANHPDLLPPSAPADLRADVQKVFGLVAGAHATLVNEDRRKAYFAEMKNREFEKQIKAESLSEQALNLIQKGKIKEALAVITQALQLHSSVTIQSYYAWIKLKSYPAATPPKVIKEIAEMMDRVPHPERRTQVYQHVLGLLRRSQGDLDGASTFFERALLLDPAFSESQKELDTIKAMQKKGFDLLNGDITTIVSNIFRKK